MAAKPKDETHGVSLCSCGASLLLLAQFRECGLCFIHWPCITASRIGCSLINSNSVTISGASGKCSHSVPFVGAALLSAEDCLYGTKNIFPL